MSLKDVDFTQIFRRLAERRIEEAMKEGKFDNLPGAGQDIVLEDIPADENARAMWWAIKILKGANIIPDEIRYRKLIDDLKAGIARATDETVLRELVQKTNDLVHKLNTMGTNAIPSQISPVDLQAELARLRSQNRA